MHPTIKNTEREREGDRGGDREREREREGEMGSIREKWGWGEWEWNQWGGMGTDKVGVFCHLTLMWDFIEIKSGKIYHGFISAQRTEEKVVFWINFRKQENG